MAQFKLEHTNIAKHKIGSQFKKKKLGIYVYILSQRNVSEIVSF